MLLYSKTVWKGSRLCSDFMSLHANICLHLVECAVPAALVAVARGRVEELLMRQRQQRAVAVGLDQDRHQRLALRRRLPGPGEYELLVRDDLAIMPADVMLLAIRRLE